MRDDKEQETSDIIGIVESLYWQRVNLVVEGTVTNCKMKDISSSELIFRDTQNEIEISIKIELDKIGNFAAKINTSSLQEGLPLDGGIWSIVIRLHSGQEILESALTLHEKCDQSTVTKIFKYGKHRYIIEPNVNSEGYLSLEIIDYRNEKRNKKNKRMKPVRKTRRFVFNALYNVFKITCKQKKNWVLFASDSRDHLSGNMKFVHDRMIERNMPYEFKFIFKSKVSEFRGIKDKFILPYYLAVSQTIFVDDYYPLVYPLKLREGTELIQLWHAVGAFKTFGYSRVGKIGGPSPFSINHRNYTKAIVSSKEIGQYYAEGFGISEDKVVSTGIPRTDIFFDETYKKSISQKIYSKYPMLKDKKIIMFAPTFRGKGAKSAYYDFDMLDLKGLAKYCSENGTIVLFKMHPFVPMEPIAQEYKEVFMDMSSYREINNLLFITDILITDYSSTCFEYALLNKPMLFYAYDLDEYISTRDFYYKYEDFVPGKICRTFNELLVALENKDYEYEKVDAFRHKFFEHTDGKSTDRVIDLVFGQEEKK